MRPSLRTADVLDAGGGACCRECRFSWADLVAGQDICSDASDGHYFNARRSSLAAPQVTGSGSIGDSWGGGS